MIANTSLLWFREDLRLADNPALHAAAAARHPLLAIFVLDTGDNGSRARGGAARWWLHHSLAALAADLKARSVTLHLFSGDADRLVPAIAKASGAATVYWNRRYDGRGREQDGRIAAALRKFGCTVETSNGRLLVEPDALHTKTGTPFRVYTPFWRALTAQGEPSPPLPAPRRLKAASLHRTTPKPVPLDDLGLLPEKPDWAGGLRDTWTPGARGAAGRLRHFTRDILDGYAKERDVPSQDATSRLSPALAFGELSPRQIWHAAHHALADGEASAASVEKLSQELAWREFSYHLLFHHPDLADRNFNARFDDFPWASRTATHLHAWQKGGTGYPIVDAGMRQLWQTGWMHNRVRLIVGSFLVKHLLIDWRKGEEWFWDTLCDADPASNAQNWQWIAGSGADAAPYFRIFNPFLQGARFDPDGTFVKRFVPELARVPARFIHRPWQAPDDVLEKAGVVLGKTYPRPIVDHDAARQRALAAFAQVKS